MVKEGQRVPITQFVDTGLRGKVAPTSSAGRAVVELKREGWQIGVAGHQTFAFGSIDVSFENRQHKSEISVTSKRIAELKITGLSDGDIIIFDDQLLIRSLICLHSRGIFE